jgi:hypothetical protein
MNAPCCLPACLPATDLHCAGPTVSALCTMAITQRHAQPAHAPPTPASLTTLISTRLHLSQACQLAEPTTLHACWQDVLEAMMKLEIYDESDAAELQSLRGASRTHRQDVSLYLDLFDHKLRGPRLSPQEVQATFAFLTLNVEVGCADCGWCSPLTAMLNAAWSMHAPAAWTLQRWDWDMTGTCGGSRRLCSACQVCQV